MLKKITRYIFLIALFGLILFMMVYLTFRLYLMVIASYHWYDKFLGGLLFLAEAFIITQGIGYVLEVVKVFLKYEKPEIDREENLNLKTDPHISILIPSYNEPLNILEDTLIGCYNLTYKNKTVVILDDTRYDQTPDEKLLKYKSDIEELCKKYSINLFRRKWRGAKAGIINDYLSFVDQKKDENFHFISFEETEENKIKAIQKPKCILVLDADQNPFSNFVQPVLAILEKDQKIAFVQTPQYYTNFQDNKIANASALQQVIFYEYICSGKSINEAVLCCGTNVILRTQALIDVGGFDESSITEDAATSIDFHMNGYKTRYFNKVGAFGLGPTDLGSYFKQQYRWSAGGIDLFKKLIKNFIKNPFKLSFPQLWEYFLSTTFYLSSFFYLILWICPILFLLFGLPSFFSSPVIYGVVFMPYFLFSTAIFFISLKKRNYSSLELLKSQFLMLICFPVFLKAAWDVFLGKKKTFEVTSKSKSEIYPIIKLWPQITLGILCFVAAVWGLNRIYYERHLIFALSINITWTMYNFLIMLSIFYFNEKKQEPINFNEINVDENIIGKNNLEDHIKK